MSKLHLWFLWSLFLFLMLFEYMSSNAFIAVLAAIFFGYAARSLESK